MEDDDILEQEGQNQDSSSSNRRSNASDVAKEIRKKAQERESTQPNGGTGPGGTGGPGGTTGPTSPGTTGPTPPGTTGPVTSGAAPGAAAPGAAAPGAVAPGAVAPGAAGAGAAGAGAAGAAGTAGAAGAAGTAGAAGAGAAGAGAAGAAAGAGAAGAAVGAGVAGAAVAAALFKILLIVGIIVLIIILIVGILTFIIAGAGLIWNAIQGVLTGIGDWITSVTVGEEKIVRPDQIEEIVNYLDELGYDLYGYGFITAPAEELFDIETHETEVEDEEVSNEAINEVSAESSEVKTNRSYKIKDEYSSWWSSDDDRRFNGSGELQFMLKAKYIYQYIISDNYAHILSNANASISSAWENIWHSVANAFGANYEDTGWGRGLIRIVEGNDNHDMDVTRWIGSDLVKIENNQIVITPERFGNKEWRYDLDGWVGRYGMPMEFLLSVHLATMAPDLTYKVSREFDTQVQIKMLKSDATIESGVSGVAADMITYDQISEAYSESRNWAQVMKDLGITSYTGDGQDGNYTCQGIPDLTEDQEANMTGENICSNWDGVPPAESDDDDGDGDAGGDDDDDDDDDDTTHGICANCGRYVKLVNSALKAIADESANYYTPYLSQAINHWYRNVYFEKTSKFNEDTIIAVDEEYEKETKERWTLYETYDVADGEDISYKLYVHLKNGSGEYDINHAQSGSTYILCQKVDDLSGNYDLAEDGITYIKSNKGAYKLVLDTSGYPSYSGSPDEFRVSKKAIEATDDQIFGGNDSAYETKTNNDGSWAVVQSRDEDGDSNVDAINDLGKTLYYKVSNYQSKDQVEDGVRGSTNSKIKEIFMDEYYIYDGSTEKAALIAKAREQYGDNPDRFPEGATVTTYLHTDEDTGQIKVASSGTEEEKVTASKKDISGPISLSQTALGAFSILKNIHTLDAEFIYHDFKELIVELNYFDKEDLVEGDAEVMMFPVLGIISNGWPFSYDKSEQFYGTLIQSKENLDSKIAEEEAKLVKLIQENDLGEIDMAEISPSGKPENAKLNADGGLSFEDNPLLQATSDIQAYEAENNYSYCVYGGNSAEECTGGEAHGLNSTFEQSQTGYHHSCCATLVKWACKLIGIEDLDTDGANACLTRARSSSKFEVLSFSRDALQPGDIVHRNGHVQIFAGFDESTGQMSWFNNGSGSSIRAGAAPKVYDSTDWDAIIRVKDLSTYTYNGIGGGGKAEPEYEGFEGGEFVVAPATGEILKYGVVKRTNVEIEKLIEKIEMGADPDNADKLEEYKSKLEQDVGFIKIKVLDVKDFTPEKDIEYEEGKKASKALKETYTEEELKKLGYNYFYEEYYDAGINGDVLYIEGFDVSEILGEGITAESQNTDLYKSQVTNIKNYVLNDDTANAYSTKYEVPNLLNKAKEFKLEIKEAAKREAEYIVEKDGKIYIKEGAIIGKTYENDNENITVTRQVNTLVMPGDEEDDEPEPDPPPADEETAAMQMKEYKVGNYLRLILRDLDDEIVEDVDTYIEKGRKNSQNDWELFFWLPFESGGTDNPGQGPESQGECSIPKGETAVGIIQWTSIVESGMNNIANQFIPGCMEENGSLCARLEGYKSWSAQDFWNDWYVNGTKEFQRVLSEICENDRDEFLHVQMEVAKKQYLEPLINSYPWLEDRPSCVQGAVMHLRVWGADTNWLTGYESKSDAEIVKKVRNKIANTSTTMGEASHDETTGRAWSEPEVALGILDGRMSTDSVEEWVRTKDTSILEDHGVPYRGG